MFGLNLPWRLIGIGVGVGLLGVLLWWTQSRIRVSYQAEQQRDQVTKDFGAYKGAIQAMAIRNAARMQRDSADDAALAARIDALELDNDKLARLLHGTPATIEVHDESGHARASINPDWWLCLGTAVSRDPADLAACEARAGHAGVPATVGR